MLDWSGSPGAFRGVLDPAAIGDLGHSDGAVVALATAANTCCTDTRLKAGAILSGATFGFEGDWFPPGSPPLLFAQGTDDQVNPYSSSTGMFAQAQSPKYFLTIDGGSHLDMFLDSPTENQIAAAIVDYFNVSLKGDQAATSALATDGNQSGYTLQSG